MAKAAGANSKASRMSGSRTVASASRSFTGTKRTASAVVASRSNVSSTEKNKPVAEFVVCIDPGTHDDLQARRIYQVLPDASAAKSRFIRVIDDSGEDYLYPESCFLPVELPGFVQAAIAKSSPKLTLDRHD